jgi:BlaI family transcriptional regulator, penicillinase repressor
VNFKMKKDLDLYIPTRRELQILKVIWEKGSATAGEVRAEILLTEKLSHNTILTLIKILENKGALTHRKSGRAFRYEPIMTRGQATRNQLRDLISRFFDGKPEKLIENLLDTEMKASEQQDTLKNILESRLQIPVFSGEAGRISQDANLSVSG